MTCQKVNHINQQLRGETPSVSGVFQRAAVRAVVDKEVEATQELELKRLRESRFVHDFSQMPIGRGGLPKEVSKTPNQTGLPDNLKAGVENLSGYSLDDVRVHYNSSKPAQLKALAYTQGTDIHVAPGQEEHLPHEAWHVVQQMQGRVKPTMQMKEVQINNDERLEREADVMGKKAVLLISDHTKATFPKSFINGLVGKNQGGFAPQPTAIQMVEKLAFTTNQTQKLESLIKFAESHLIPWLEAAMYEGEAYSEKAIFLHKNFINALDYYQQQFKKPTESQDILSLTFSNNINFTTKQMNSELEKYGVNGIEGKEQEEDVENPLSIPKTLYRWVSTEEAKRAKKEGISFDPKGGGIPTSTKAGKGIAIQSGAVNVSKCLVITTRKIPNFKFEYVPTRSKLKEVKVKCNIPSEAIQ